MNPQRCHVWVTRPQPGAAQTGDRLADLGYKPYVAPLTEVVGVAADLSALSDCAALVFTSANGARFFPSDMALTLSDKPVFAVGSATADAVRALGFTAVTIGPGDATSLVPIIVDQTETGDRIGYITGRKRTGTLEESLQSFGRNTVLIEIYDTKKVSQITYSETDFFSTDAERVVMVYSVLSAEALVDRVDGGDLPQNIENALFIAISPRVAAVLDSIATLPPHVAQTPNEAGMMAALAGLTQ